MQQRELTQAELAANAAYLSRITREADQASRVTQSKEFRLWVARQNFAWFCQELSRSCAVK